MPTFSFTPSDCEYTLTETISYPTYVATPSTVFTYTSGTRALVTSTSATAAVGAYTVQLKATNPYDSSNNYVLSVAVTVAICSLTITSTTQSNLAYYVGNPS